VTVCCTVALSARRPLSCAPPASRAAASASEMVARALVACCLLLGLAAAHAGVERSAILQRRGDASALRPHRSYSDDRTACLRAERQRQLQSLRGGGATISRLLPILLGKQQCRILMVGLDAAGKTTILYQLKLGEMTQTKPTLGFNVETVAYKNIEFMVWDMGGQDRIRQLWRHYYKNAQALIFVVDSADEERPRDEPYPYPWLRDEPYPYPC